MKNKRSTLLAKTVRVPFRSTSSTARTASSGYQFTEVDLTIASFTSDRIAAMAPFYKFFRIVSCDITLFGDVTGVCLANSGVVNLLGYSHALSYVPTGSSEVGACTTYDDMLQYPNAVYGPNHQRLSLHLTSKDMIGSQPLKWLYTKNTGSIPNSELSAGSITYATYVAAATTSTLSTSWLLVDGIMEFKGPVEDSLSQTISVLQDEQAVLRDWPNPRGDSLIPVQRGLDGKVISPFVEQPASTDETVSTISQFSGPIADREYVSIRRDYLANLESKSSR